LPKAKEDKQDERDFTREGQDLRFRYKLIVVKVH